MANMINMAFLITNELHNVADRMDPIIKSVQNELAVRAEQADSFTDQEVMADIEQPLQDDPFMALLMNVEMDNEFRDYGTQSSQHRQLHHYLRMIRTKTTFLARVW